VQIWQGSCSGGSQTNVIPLPCISCAVTRTGPTTSVSARGGSGPARPHNIVMAAPAQAGIKLRRPPTTGCCKTNASMSLDPINFLTAEACRGSPKFTNEVQHLVGEVLPWEPPTNNCHLRTGARLPVFTKTAVRFAKSQQIWIARHPRLLGSLSATAATSQHTPASRPRLGGTSPAQRL
jgi:hypothetical protein